MKALDVRIILSQEILKIEPTNFGPFWTENRLLSQCAGQQVPSSLSRENPMATTTSSSLPIVVKKGLLAFQ